MHRTGHFGMSLIWAAGVALAAPPLLAAPLAFVLVATEPIPDRDMKISWIDHRGFSHTVWAGVLVAFLLGGIVVGAWVLLRQRAVALTVLPQPILEASPTPPVIFAVVATGTFLGYLSHISADMITVGEGYYGVQPFMPFTEWESGIQLCKAASPLWNRFLFSLGSVAVSAAIYLKIEVIGVVM